MRKVGLGQGERVAVAVSGGPDSMALAFCLKRYGGEGADGRLLGLIVEHGLRDESAAEAAAVAARLEAMGIEARILPWVHEVVESRIHVRARDARYALLLQACREVGIRHLFLAHHAGDQAETILMRFAKGSGIDGLAGMALATSMGDVTLWRPLLEVPKARLEATCAAAGIAFVTDPSNEKDKYARGRLRRLGPLLEEEGFTVERLLDLGARAREAKEALDHYASALLRESVTRLDGGMVRLDLVALRGVPRAVGLRAVTRLLEAINRSEDYAPRRRQLLPLMDWLADQDEEGARTLAGCLIVKGELCAKALFIREAADATDVLPIAAGQSVLWDGRWQVRYEGDETGLEVRALGRQPHELLDRLAPSLRKRVQWGRARAALPALWAGDELKVLPDFFEENQSVVTAFYQEALGEKSA